MNQVAKRPFTGHRHSAPFTLIMLTLSVPTTLAADPDLSIGAAQFPGEDAVILRWDNAFTLEADGKVHRREHRWVKLLNDRPIRDEGDPRIDFVADRDELIIHAARTHLPNGTILPVPDYSFNDVGPDDVAGWPAYDGWQQKVVSFSGIENGAVLELDYEVVTPAGVLPWLEGSLRVQQEHPIIERVISVSVPKGTALHHALDPVPGFRNWEGPATSDAGKLTTHKWTAHNLPGDRPEAQSPPWPEQYGRFRFTTCPDAATWAATILRNVDRATPDEAIKGFAKQVVKDELDPAEQVLALAKKFRDSFNYIESVKTYRSLTCRPASEVFQANYGNPLEAAALLAAAMRSLDANVSLAVGVDADLWNPVDNPAPTDEALTGVVLNVDLGDRQLQIHPQRGEIRNPGAWGPHWLLSVDSSGSLQTGYVAARGEKVPSELAVVGKLAVDSEGKVTGELRFRLTGAFFDPLALEDSDAQKAKLAGVLEHVLTGFDVTDFSLAALDHSALRATASVASKEALWGYGEQHVLKFGDGPAFLHDIHLPLADASRRHAVSLVGEVREQIDLLVEMPEGWKASILPGSLEVTKGPWGEAAQQVEVEDRTVRFRRMVNITTDTITASDFAGMRETLNNLRADRSLVLAMGN